MRVEVVNTGTELLLGKVINTHAAYFGNELFKLGLRVQRQTTIPDGDDIRVVLEEAFPRTDVILITGGLGPTHDDITREVVAEMLGRELHLDQSILNGIREMFVSRGLKMNPSNNKQAMVPDGAEVLDNPNGTAPGLFVPTTENSPHLFLLPGPPRELKPMMENLVIPKLGDLLGPENSPDGTRNFRIYGVGESAIAGRLEAKFNEIDDLEVGYCARLGEVDVRLIGPESAIEAAAELVRVAYPRQIVTESEDPIEKVIVGMLRERGETVATAESCTGGQIASTITNTDGSSAVFGHGFVTYANEAKAKWLGVPMELIEEHGAVSEEVVRAMAAGCLEASGADHAIAVSGIAGPGGGTDEKPVGTVQIAIASREGGIFAKRYYQPVDRLSFKTRVTRLALDLLRQRLAGFELK
ncbi:MAG: competence/damage-inducible protein A [Verrucomicrobiales bacterium]|nr:competence/damage-inducible protein A [Verrucomicrobiales bacterium]